VSTPLSQEEIRSFGFMIVQEGKEASAGHGTTKEGAAVCEFGARCAAQAFTD